MKALFEKSRNTEMSEEEFKVLILTYPIFLVAKADGTFDEDEKQLLSTILLNFLSPLYGDKIDKEQYDSLIVNYLEDFEFLYKKEETFKTGFLNELKEFNQNVKDSISSLLNEIAEISDGIDENELKVIEELKSEYLK
jgi:hypothetical protein